MPRLPVSPHVANLGSRTRVLLPTRALEWLGDGCGCGCGISCCRHRRMGLSAAVEPTQLSLVSIIAFNNKIPLSPPGRIASLDYKKTDFHLAWFGFVIQTAWSIIRGGVDGV